ncbi:DUF6879 family protein [Streptoalloteichus hindustanus]|nr:DUF6879 family protein [Streptoalloteichus hindustanus]
MRAYERTAWRYEAKPLYTVDGDMLAQYLAGEPEPEDHNRDWHDKIRADRVAGKSMQRVKVVRRPFNDYTRYLMDWAIPGNVAAGEDYRILDVTEGGPDLPDQDFWLFDDEVVVHLDYHFDGTVSGIELVQDPDLSWYRGLRETVVKLAVPFREYVGA